MLRGLPATHLVAALVAAPLRLSGGRVLAAAEVGQPPELLDAVDRLTSGLRDHPYAAPDADQLRALGLDNRALAAAERAGPVQWIAAGVVLLPGADIQAAGRLAEQLQPFTTSEARRCLASTRRVVIPLKERLDRPGLTRRLADDRRELR